MPSDKKKRNLDMDMMPLMIMKSLMGDNGTNSIFNNKNIKVFKLNRLKQRSSKSLKHKSENKSMT
jgi:hypothetical protein